MASATTIKFGDNLDVTDEGAGVIRVDGGGGSLPDWWTVDSTPGSEEVDFAGEVHITPQAGNVYGLFLQSSTDFENNYNSFIRIIGAAGQESFNVDTGGMDLRAANGDFIHVRVVEEGTANSFEMSTTGMQISSETFGTIFAHLSAASGLQLLSFTPASAVGSNRVQMYYEGTTGAPKVHFRGKDDLGDPFSAVINLT